MTAKLYTGYGDKGCTFTKRNPQTPKHDKLIHLIGEIDELNSYLGYLVYLLEKKFHQAEYSIFQNRIQSLLFHVGAFLGYNTPIKKEVLQKAISVIEYQIDDQEKKNQPIKNFILPYGTQAASFSHICRSKARSVERLFCEHLAHQDQVSEINTLIQILFNRLSDYYFSLARTINRINGKKDLLWKADSSEYDF